MTRWRRSVRVVLDTNILIGALITKGTPPDSLYQAWLRDEFELVTSLAQLSEMARAIVRPRLRRFVDVDEAAAIVKNIGARAVVPRGLPVVDLSPDPSDNPILATAIAGKADLLVSCVVNSRDKSRRIFRRRQGAMTSSGGYHARKSNAADGEKDQRIIARIYDTGH